MNSTAKVISYNSFGEDISACAARISTTKGDALEIFDASKDREKNRGLIKKVLSSGHKSILEHTVFTIAFCNVSAVVEEFFIEHRLASFTVKSRRYVDYSNLGYYVPPDLASPSESVYRAYMEQLFSAYHSLVDRGIPKEDARFLLPYSFHSNFYCTVNGRELAHILRRAHADRLRPVPEVVDLLDQIAAQLEELCPSLLAELNQAPSDQAEPLAPVGAAPDPAPVLLDASQIGGVEFVQCPAEADAVIKAAGKILHPRSSPYTGSVEALENGCGRVLEQLVYTFQISDITLSGLTHLVRHRMQSLLVPDIREMPLDKCVLPPAVCLRPEEKELYTRAVQTAFEMRAKAMQDPALQAHRCYFALSGNLCNVMTSMNARELMEFIRLRSCNRAQWEIRDITIRLLKQLREHAPALFNAAGPSCYSRGYCPEGKMTCGKMSETVSSFSSL